MTTTEIKKPKYVCPECGCATVQISAWIDVNTGKDAGGDGPTDEAWCSSCDKNIDHCCCLDTHDLQQFCERCGKDHTKYNRDAFNLLVESEGWNEATLLGLAIDFIDWLGLRAEFNHMLAGRAMRAATPKKRGSHA